MSDYYYYLTGVHDCSSYVYCIYTLYTKYTSDNVTMFIIIYFHEKKSQKTYKNLISPFILTTHNIPLYIHLIYCRIIFYLYSSIRSKNINLNM